MPWSKKRIDLYFYRNIDNVEVDFILEDPAGKIVAIEIKASDTVNPDDFSGIKYLQENYKMRFEKGIMLYTGSQIVPFAKNIFAWPISSLWAKQK